MERYDADREPDPDAWLDLDEATRMDLVVQYHRRQHPRTPRLRVHAIFHTIVENQLAANEAGAVETIERLQTEGLSRHDAVHAIGSVLAGHVHGLLKHDRPSTAEDPNEMYAAALRKLTAQNWYNEG